MTFCTPHGPRVALLAFGLSIFGTVGAAPAPHGGEPRHQAWITEMKETPRGPFDAIRWFCKDGRVLPPSDFSCAKRGEGWQHGQWSERTRQLRGQGYLIATLLAGKDVDAAVAAPGFADDYAQWLIERYLVATDNGWIMRRAQFYRGAIQEEDEREFARRLLIAMAGRDEWVNRRYLALRTGIKLLPHGADTASAQKVRQQAAALAGRDAGFAPLRVKIHGSPAAEDAAAVREYAVRANDPALAASARELAAAIDALFAPVPLDQQLERAAQALPNTALAQTLRSARAAWLKDASAGNRFLTSAWLLADLREALPKLPQANARLRALDLSLAVEAEHFRAASELRAATERVPRSTDIALLGGAVDAAYGAGMLNARERTALRESLAKLKVEQIALGDYLRELRYLGLVPGWGTQALALHFGEAMAKLGEIEPLAHGFGQDQLRGSPLFFYSQTLDLLARDANRAAGVQHQLFGAERGTGFNALNPGLARGVLHAAPDMRRVADFKPDGIYLLAETVSELPPVAGILTAGAGNPISHVQLLARNLGIPNVAVDESLLPELRKHDGERIVLAVSAAGRVEIAADGPQWDAAFGTQKQAASDVVFEVDLKKLDLSQRDFISLEKLRATDSGRIVGPKAAKLGELKSHFPDRVAPGVAIPFGLYKQAVLDRPYRDGKRTVYQWMVESFRQLESLPPGSPQAAAAGEKLRAEIYSIVVNTDPGPEFRRRLREAMAREFGAGFNGGVFVRSDTNAEDLPGFTGAGMNLTVFNVVGFDNTIRALNEVWASPYTPRAWAWRQAHMKGPEHLYPAVLLLRTVPSDISGVMITQDVDTGDSGVLSVAVNEGVGGAVDGQAAESVRITRANGSLRLMASATTPRRLVPSPKGGIDRLPVSGDQTLLEPGEAAQLIAFADEIPRKFPQLGEDGKPVAADVEFGFVGGKMWLLQIRPFNESRAARASAYLQQMDQSLRANLARTIDLRESAR